jgi:hypothetical protein
MLSLSAVSMISPNVTASGQWWSHARLDSNNSHSGTNPMAFGWPRIQVRSSASRSVGFAVTCGSLRSCLSLQDNKVAASGANF